jgi:hypothetical protein
MDALQKSTVCVTLITFASQDLSGYCRDKVIRLLLEHCPNPDVRCNDGALLFEKLAYSCNYATLKYLVNAAPHMDMETILGDRQKTAVALSPFEIRELMKIWKQRQK